MDFSWKTKGIVLTAPLNGELDEVVRFIDEYLAPRGFNTVVLQVRYRYQFKNHPEVWGYDPLCSDDVKRLLAVCRKNGIRLIPKMNLFGHQSGLHNEPTDGILHGHNDERADERDGLLRAYPELDEQVDKDEVYYARSICPSNPTAKKIVFELIDELIDEFEADAVHIGCDEAFNIGECPVCSQKTKGELFADWVNSINAHVRARGKEVLMWGDRLISVEGAQYHGWEACEHGTDTHTAIEKVSRNIVVCDWHYDKYDAYGSIDTFAEAGFEIMISPWRDKEALEAFVNYAKAHDKGHIRGILMTTWCGSGELARRLLYGERGKWLHTEQIAKTIEEVFQ